MLFCRFWGKTSCRSEDADFHLLPYHCLDAAAVASVLLDHDKLLRQKIASILGLDEGLSTRLSTFFISLHDIGKFAEGFQNLRPEIFYQLQDRRIDKAYTIRHDALGYLLWRSHIWDYLWKNGLLPHDRSEGNKRQWGRVFEHLFLAASGHHGIPPGLTGPAGLPLVFGNHFGAETTKSAEAFSEKAAHLFLGDAPSMDGLPPRTLLPRARKASWLLAGLAVLCDWIASGHFPFCQEPMQLEQYWHQHAMPGAAEALRRTGVLPNDTATGCDYARLFPWMDALTPLQEFAIQCNTAGGPSLFIFEDLTGSGKTEAAMMLVARLMEQGLGTGLFVGLPTMATSNAMYARLSQSYRKLFADNTFPSLALAHGMNRLSKAFRETIIDPKRIEDRKYGENDDETASAQCISWLADNRKKALLADVGVGTLDQALLAVLPNRHQCLRLWGLSRHILVVDEVHSYDPYMHRLLQTLLRFQAAMGGSAILLSATLPHGMRQELVDSFCEGLEITSSPLKGREAYPHVTHACASGTVETPVRSAVGRQSRIEIRHITNRSDIEQLIISEASNGHCVCWVRNTVADAVEAYESLSRKPEIKDGLILFHSRFAMGDRLEIEDGVLSVFGKEGMPANRPGKVLIGTQVIEQSLDLDFDVLISDLAPMDLMIQRAGRLHRHARDLGGNLLPHGLEDRRGMPVLYLYTPDPWGNMTENWYRAFFPRAAHVYPSHGRLWLTARLLLEKGGWQMPKDARELIEAVFSNDSENLIPELLRRRDRDADAKQKVQASVASMNSLRLELGYVATAEQWFEGTLAPTRLGEAETTVRLARWGNGVLRPWYGKGDYPWDMSQVRVRSALVRGKAATQDADLRQAIEMLKENMADRCRWSVFVPLSPDDFGTWSGKAVDGRGKEVVVVYSRDTGLQVHR